MGSNLTLRSYSFNGKTNQLIPVAARSKMYFCSDSIPGIAGSKPTDGMDFYLFCCCCVGSGLCSELIAHSEESYRLCVSESG